MKIGLIALLLFSLFVFTFCRSATKSSELHPTGLYRGHKWGFIPQPIVYADFKNNEAHVECYLPLKASYFIILRDTLLLDENENDYKGTKSKIYLEGDRYYFTAFSQDVENFKVPTTALKKSEGSREELNEIRAKAKVWQSY